jgi:hypothetical protein
MIHIIPCVRIERFVKGKQGFIESGTGMTQSVVPEKERGMHEMQRFKIIYDIIKNLFYPLIQLS